VLLWGSPETGKTSVVRALGDALERPTEVVIGSIREPDQGEARDGIERAFAGMLEVDQGDGSIPMVDGGSNLGACLEEAARRNSVQSESVGSRTVVVDALTSLNDHLARVLYSAAIS
jgi:hypothetical protein